MTDLRLRVVTGADAELLWTWANDRAVRSQAFSTSPIAWDDHVAWLARTLSSAATRIWILEADRRPAGQVRFDADGSKAEIDYSIASDFRGSGLAAQMLRLAAPAACAELAVERLSGVVKEANAPSCRAFERAGFALAETIVMHGHPCRRYEWRCAASSAEARCVS